jgi:hypothetical protein
MSYGTGCPAVRGLLRAAVSFWQSQLPLLLLLLLVH